MLLTGAARHMDPLAAVSEMQQLALRDDGQPAHGPAATAGEEKLLDAAPAGPELEREDSADGGGSGNSGACNGASNMCPPAAAPEAFAPGDVGAPQRSSSPVNVPSSSSGRSGAQLVEPDDPDLPPDVLAALLKRASPAAFSPVRFSMDEVRQVVITTST